MASMKTSATETGAAAGAGDATSGGPAAAASAPGAANSASPSGAALAASGSAKSPKSGAGAANTGSATEDPGPGGRATPSGGASSGSGGSNAATARRSAPPSRGMEWTGPGRPPAWFTPPNHPAVAEWLATMKQYVPGTGASANGGIGWVSAKVFELAAKAMPDTPTSQGVLEGLWTIKGNDIGGMTRPLTYVKDQPAVQTPACWFAVQMNDNKGGWTGDRRICV